MRLSKNTSIVNIKVKDINCDTVEHVLKQLKVVKVINDFVLYNNEALIECDSKL